MADRETPSPRSPPGESARRAPPLPSDSAAASVSCRSSRGITIMGAWQLSSYRFACTQAPCTSKQAQCRDGQVSCGFRAGQLPEMGERVLGRVVCGAASAVGPRECPQPDVQPPRRCLCGGRPGRPENLYESGFSPYPLFSKAKGLVYSIPHTRRHRGFGLWQIGEWSAHQSSCSWPQ